MSGAARGVTTTGIKGTLPAGHLHAWKPKEPETLEPPRWSVCVRAKVSETNLKRSAVYILLPH